MARDDTQRQILNAAGEIFAAKGFKAATIREICHRAGVNLAAVNYYFGDKERLYIEAVKHARRLREEQQPLPTWSDETPPADKLRMLVTTLLRRILGKDGAPWQMRLITREVMEPTRACEEMVQEAFRPYFQLLLDILQQLLPEDTPRHRLHQLGFSVIAQCVYFRTQEKIVSMLIEPKEREQHYGPEQLAEHIAQVTLAAVGNEAHLGERFNTSGSSEAAKEEQIV